MAEMKWNGETRPLELADMPAVGALLDATLGAGFWSLAPGGRDAAGAGMHRVAMLDGQIVGFASATLVDGGFDLAPGIALPIGLIRIVAVAAGARRRGLGARLAGEVGAACGELGAASLAAFAWVYARTGSAPLAGVLEGLGFVRERRIEGFYAASGTAPCPGCGESPCICAADLYVKPVVEGE